MSNRIRYFLPVILLAAVLSSGCPRRPVEPELTTLTIAFQSWVGYGPFYLAKEKGFLKDEGIDLVVVDEQLDSARNDAFREGILDLEGATIDTLMFKRSRDIPVVAVMVLDYSNGADGIVVIEPIKKLDDLIGKKIAFAPDDASENFLSYLFFKAGLDMNKIDVVACRPEEVAQVFLSGKADAAGTWEPWLSQALKRPGTHILVSSKDEPGIVVDILNVREGLVRDNPRAVKALMRAWFRAVKFYKEHPEESSVAIAKYYKISPEEYRKNAAGLIWPEYAQQNTPRQRSKYADVFRVLAEVESMDKTISKVPDVQNAFNWGLLENLYEDSR